MYLIKDKSDRYLKINIDNKIKFVNNETLADVFPSEREATVLYGRYLRKRQGKIIELSSAIMILFLI